MQIRALQKPWKPEEGNGKIYSKCWKEKDCQPRILYPVKYPLKTNRKIKTNEKLRHSHMKMRELIASRLSLQEILKKVTQAKKKKKNTRQSLKSKWIKSTDKGNYIGKCKRV